MLGRRDLLKYAAVLPLAQVLAASPLSARASTAPVRFIIDPRLPDAARLIEQARRGGHAIADPEGEIIRLILDAGDSLPAYAGSLLGLTGYSDFVLARDALRMAGRPMWFAAQVDSQGMTVLFDSDAARKGTGNAAAIRTLFAPSPSPTRSSTSFVWLA